MKKITCGRLKLVLTFLSLSLSLNFITRVSLFYLKSRLCVQGCRQVPGVDYDQTWCGAMRGDVWHPQCKKT